MNKGKFIVFEGLDGSGSTTHADLLLKKLNRIGQNSVATKEPTNNLIGGAIRGVLTNEWSISSEGLQLLFSADRAHHIDRLIKPTIEKGVNVICDRYMYSTFAFGAGSGADVNWLKEMNKFFLVPDIVVLLKVSPEECIRRISTGRAEFELFEELENLKKVWGEYEKIAAESDHFIIIDGERDMKTVEDEIYKVVLDKLSNG